VIPELLAIIKEKKRISLSDLSVLSKQREEVIEQIMEQLSRKNLVKKDTILCHGCMKDCTTCLKRGDLIFYEIV